MEVEGVRVPTGGSRPLPVGGGGRKGPADLPWLRRQDREQRRRAPLQAALAQLTKSQTEHRADPARRLRRGLDCRGEMGRVVRGRGHRLHHVAQRQHGDGQTGGGGGVIRLSSTTGVKPLTPSPTRNPHTSTPPNFNKIVGMESFLS